MNNKQYDVIVVGGGPAGIAAAVAASEQGAQTLLIEAAGELGGTGTSGAVSHWLGGRRADCSDFVVGGLFKRWVLEAEKEDIAVIPKLEINGYSPYGWEGNPHLTAGIPFKRFEMSEFLDRKCLKAGVEILFYTRFVSAVRKDDHIENITFHNKSGLFTLAAGRYIDATGDIDLAASIGVPLQLGREEDNLMAPATLEFQVSHVDHQLLKQYIDTEKAPRFLKEIKYLQEKGIWNFPYDRFISVQMPEQDTFLINTSRLVGVNGIDGKDVSKMMIQGRREIKELFSIMQAHFPGFANARISCIATNPGVRETRRLKGNFTLKSEDLINGTTFDDVIGFCCYGWDLPDPKRPSFQPMTEQNIMIKGDIIPLPYRIMLPAGANNLICPGRGVSVERDVLGPVRVMASCMVMGEAAGVASSIGDDFSTINIAELQNILKARNCIIDLS